MNFPFWEEGFLLSDEDIPSTIKFFTSLHRTARIWMSFGPAPPLNRGGAMLLGIIDHRTQNHPEQPTTVSALARMLHMSTPAITQKVNLLEEQGLVKRVTQEEDRRVAHLQLSEEGERLAQEARGGMVKHLDTALEAMGSEKATRLIDLMEEFSLNLEKESTNATPRTPLP